MLDIVRRFCARLAREERAQGMAEYAMLAGFVALAVVATITLLGGNIKATLNNIAGSVGAAS